MPPRFSRFLSCLALLAVSCSFAAPLFGEIDKDSRQICARAAGEIERVSGLPSQLLEAIAKVESGRWYADRGENFSWPWTITAEGRGHFLPSKAAAVAKVEALRRRGVTSIDVGCMQVNLHYHGQHFETLDEALDPLSNIAYAAAFLSDLKQEVRSWERAVGYYHSRHETRGLAYRTKVYEAWNEVRRRAAKASY